MKRILVLTTVCMLTLGAPITAFASSLDEVVSGQETTTSVEQTEATEQPTQQPAAEQPAQPAEPAQPAPQSSYTTDEYLQDIQHATDLSEPSPGATKVNQGITKVASFIVQILAYFITAFLVVRVVIDLCYICIPFTRSFLANGYGGNPQAGGGGMGMQQPGMGMGGMGMGGMGMGAMGGMGMGGMGMGMRGRYGMGGMGGMGAGMNMGAMQGQMGANPAMGRIQWVSTAALNAAAAESVVGPDGKAISPLKTYAKDMVVVLVVTPILLTLAITGVLTDLGFLLGSLLADAVSNIGTML